KRTEETIRNIAASFDPEKRAKGRLSDQPTLRSFLRKGTRKRELLVHTTVETLCGGPDKSVVTLVPVKNHLLPPEPRIKPSCWSVSVIVARATVSSALMVAATPDAQSVDSFVNDRPDAAAYGKVVLPLIRISEPRTP